MPATVEIDESNGTPSEVVTHGILSLAMGTTDAPNMVAGAVGARQAPNSNSMQKALRLHVTDLGGSAGVSGVRAFSDPSVFGWSWFANAHATQATYDASKRTSYVPPLASVSAVPHALPTSDPLAPSLGIVGSLTGTLVVAGVTDYLYLQLRAAAAVSLSFIAPFFFAYDESG